MLTNKKAYKYNGKQYTYLWELKEAMPNVGFPSDVTDKQLKELGVEVINIEPVLDDVKAQKKFELKYERDKREVAVIAYKGKTFDYDDKARERLNIARQALEDNNLPSQMWTCADNTDIELTVEDFKNINSLAAQRSGQLHDTYRKLCDYIDKLKTADEVNAVTFDTEVIQ